MLLQQLPHPYSCNQTYSISSMPSSSGDCKRRCRWQAWRLVVYLLDHHAAAG